jgi:hypothetical protein
MGRSAHAGRSGRNELAQHFTPEPVARFVWSVAAGLAARRGPVTTALDPAAGAGVFLGLARAAGVAAVGIELDPALAAPAAQSSGARLLVGDALRQRFPMVPDAGFEVVVGNPPFGRLGRFSGDLGAPVWDTYALLAPLSGRSARAARASFPIDQLFLERAVGWVCPGGIVALVMPEGFVANDRHRRARDWALTRAWVVATVSLPAHAFSWPGLNARTTVVFLRRRAEPNAAPGTWGGDRGGASAPADAPRRRPWGDDPPALLLRPPLTRRPALAPYLAAAAGWLLRDLHPAAEAALAQAVAQEQLVGQRWDAGWWLRQRSARTWGPGLDRRPLGDFIEHLTYGPIVTGTRPVPQEGGIRVVLQADFEVAGLALQPALRVAPGSVFDPPRSRVQRGDLLLPRSGAGSLGRGRMAVYTDNDPANVGCFVDRLRLRGINPFYVWVFLRTAAGQDQIQQVINGVGTPNLSFGEIRSLLIPCLATAEQDAYEGRYRAEVLPLHASGQAALAAVGFGCLVTDLEGRLRAP